MKNVIAWLTSRTTIANTSAVHSIALLLLRVWIGSIMAFTHGWGKLSNFSERVEKFSDPIGLGSAVSLTLAVSAEFFCSMLLILGLFTRGAVIPIMVTMLVAGFIVHADDPWQRKELAFMFLGALLTIFIAGPGKYSLDNLLSKKQS